MIRNKSDPAGNIPAGEADTNIIEELNNYDIITALFSETEASPANYGENLSGSKRSSLKEVLHLAGRFISTFIVTIIVVAALALAVIKLTGCGLFTIESGSMTPAYPVNTVVLVKPAEFEEIEIGDVITYVLNGSGTLVTHRVIAINTEDKTFTTKGDANSTADTGAVLYENVVGKVVAGIPKIGAIVRIIGAQENRSAMILIIAIFIIGLVEWDVLRMTLQNK